MTRLKLVSSRIGAALDDLATPAKVANNTIYFDAQRPSAIVLPVVTGAL